MSEQIEKTSELKKNNSIWRRYRVAAILVLLCLLSVYIYGVLTWKSQSQIMSEKIIRQNAASILVKKANQLTNDDFAGIKKLYLKNTGFSGKSIGVQLSDIKLIGKFINLQELHLNNIRVSQQKPSSIMVLLEKLKIVKSPASKYIYIDLSPLKNLTKLEILTLVHSEINNIKPLAFLKNLKELDISYTEILDIEPLCELPNLEKLTIEPYSIKNLKQITRIKKLKELKLNGQIDPDAIKYLETVLPDLKINIILNENGYDFGLPIIKFPVPTE